MLLNNSDDDLCETTVKMDNAASDVEMLGPAEQAQAILSLEEESWPYRQGDGMALISCE